ncbi:MAG: hypothetical protein WAP51_02160 [Candidatus Sungiibacteriota bacterium]
MAKDKDEIKQEWHNLVYEYFKGGNAQGRAASLVYSDLMNIYKALKEVEAD